MVLSYNSSTGVITYNGPTATETRAHGGTGVGITNGQVSIGQSVGTTDDVKFGTVTANLTGNVTGNLTGNVTGDVTGNVTGDVTGDLTGDVTGTVSSLSNHTTDSLQEASEGATNLYFTQARARGFCVSYR